jgi:hypothetical protein
MSDVSTVVGSYSGIVSIVLIVFGAIYGAVNHKRIRSNCCGREVSASLDIENTSPKPPVVV